MATEQEKEEIRRITDYYNKQANLHTKMLIYGISFPEQKDIGGLKGMRELVKKGIFSETIRRHKKEYEDEIERRVLAYEAEHNKAA